MKRNYYIFSSGKLIRRQNTLYFEPGMNQQPEEETEISKEEELAESEEDENEEPADDQEPRRIMRRPVPVEDIETIYCFSELRFNTKFLNFMSQKQVPLHFFNYYGYYTGTFYPREPYISGMLIVKQVEAYKDPDARIIIARKFIEGGIENMRKNLLYYNSRDKDMSFFLEKFEDAAPGVLTCKDIKELMGIEGNLRSIYYKTWALIINDDIEFNKREKHPPTNPVNALISFGNSLVYTTVLSELYKTQLNPLISYLHEPGERRFSLALDIAEVFKPLLCDRIIFSLLNKKQLNEKHFTKEFNYCHLNDEGRKIYLQEYDERLKTTIQHRTLKKPVSYRHLVRLECYKLVKHILGEKEYKPFKIWW